MQIHLDGQRSGEVPLQPNIQLQVRQGKEHQVMNAQEILQQVVRSKVHKATWEGQEARRTSMHER